jgi:hypothetical protein
LARPGGLAEQEKVLRRRHRAAQHCIGVIGGGAADGEFAEFGGGVDAPAPPRVPGGGIECGRDDGGS